MCGISGYFTKNNFFDKDDLEAMVTVQNHRGPDSNGTFFHQQVGLGHNRLSIIDLSERGAQPMHSFNDRYTIVYNGEVYNYAEVAAELKFNFDPDFHFRSGTDTEVILQAFAGYGVDAVKHLNGMFSFAIYDKQEEDLYLFRDRLGIKPLYYYWDGEDFAFASEIKSLKIIRKLNLQVNYSVIPQYLHLGYIPSPYSIYENCYKLEPGHYLKISKNNFEKKQYWSISSSISEKIITNEKQALVVISDLLASSVQYQLKSDVPYGVFLSGGIDSSLVAANASKLSGTKINTFSIGFENEKFNEAIYAKQIATYLGTNHHEFTVTVTDAINALDDYMDAYGEPFADSSGIPTLLVSRLAKKYVTVALSGEGGDELFHGYGAYNWASRLDNFFIKHSKSVVAKLLKASTSSRNKRAAEMFSVSDEETIRSHIFSQEQYFFSADEINLFLKKKYLSPVLLHEILKYTDTAFANSIAEIKNNRKLFPQEKQALYDLQFYLPDDLLVKVDRASMHYSLETRVPYLDHRLVEEAINVSTALKNNPAPKYILKEILYQHIPKSYFDRPKQGFSIPLKHWLHKEMRFLIDDYLNETIVAKVDVVDYTYVKQILQRFESGDEYLFQRIWLLVNLHWWFTKNVL
ncbi:MAG TPA: asparagine synthase (glutamine-hydrolyzing) [Bacteroidia bacterium]|jgi:asparagine synthase (glutamine-hydrolysing)|nr:asparagine synthase (glutamine-hydrolyzing) [Bacteroidia bacterium]